MALLAIAAIAAGPGLTPLSCDGMPADHHAHRAIRLATTAYSLDRWRDPTPATDAEKRGWRAHKRCLLDSDRRERIARQIDRLRERFERYRARRLAYVRQWGTCAGDAPAGSRSVKDCIAGAAREYGVSYALMLGIATCESRLNRLARNATSTASGLFQHLYPSTWASTPYASRSVWSARWASLAAAYMIARGRRGEWAC